MNHFYNSLVQFIRLKLCTQGRKDWHAGRETAGWPFVATARIGKNDIYLEPKYIQSSITLTIKLFANFVTGRANCSNKELKLTIDCCCVQKSDEQGDKHQRQAALLHCCRS
jgi:hypothetical protein